MKRTLTLIVALICALSSSAQTSGGPDLYGYTWKNSNHTVSPPAYSWFDISTIGTQVSGLGDDNTAGPFDISGGFQFYWYPTTKFWIGSNGYIAFNGVNIASPFPNSIPLATGANDWIAVMMADLNFAGSNNPAKCYYYYNTDTLCISWVDVPFWMNTTPPYTGSNTFQVIFNKADKSITMNYKAMNMGSTTSLDNLIGIENITGSIGLHAMIDNFPSSLFTIKYYYPSVVTYAVTDGGMNWNANPVNGGIFVKKGGPPMPLTASIKNFGNQPLGSFTVLDTVRNAANTAITSGSITVPSLAAQVDSTVTFPNTFVAPLPGTYTYRTAVSGINGDMVASNNKKLVEVIAIDTTTAMMMLDYSDAMPEAGLAWNGADGGIGVYFEPPVYPARIISSQYVIYSNGTPAVGFHALIYDDDGPNGTPGTLLDSVYVPPTAFSLGIYYNVPTATPNLVIPDGGVYVAWIMDGIGINIAKDLTPPFSARSYEVISGAWANYRDYLTEDFMIALIIQRAAPVAAFSVDTLSDPVMSFSDMSMNFPSSWHWDFGDGTTSTLEDPSHTYASSGTFDVCLKVTNAAGVDSTCHTITVYNAVPTAGYSYTTMVMTVTFTDLTMGSPTSWLWDFDDGNTSTAQHPVHTYANTGLYDVCLTATNSFGPSAPYCQTVNMLTIDAGDEPQQNCLLVYPNPASDNVLIMTDKETLSDETELLVHTVLGTGIPVDFTVDGHSIRMNCSGLPPGIYIISVRDGQEYIAGGRILVR